ncbi:MAG: dihydroxyacetone kinase subunit DhaK [Aerococcus sp.]|nr:dihydroxyacetone kinase subunit DhaK [Aerococcus sp.]
MKKIINQPSAVVDEMVSGLSRTHSDLVHRLEDTNVIVHNHEHSGKVGLISGGGSGHEPAHAGFVGQGMLSAAVCGEIFTSPTPDQILKAIEAADEGAGVFMIVKNYSGDVMNFEMAEEMAEMEDIQVKHIVVDDDITVAKSDTQGRRGVAGTLFVHKILGYAAERGDSLDQISNLAEKIVKNIWTVGLALSGATVPEVGKPGFTLADDEIEFGIGIHGEPGYSREKIQSSQGMATELVDKLLAEVANDAPSGYGILVNGMGATPLMEQYIFANDVLDLLEEKSLNVAFKKVGNLMTSIDMAGISLTIIALQDNFWLEALNAPVNTIAW